MEYPVRSVTLNTPEINEREILRYAGIIEKKHEISGILSECLRETENILTFNVCYSTYPITVEGDSVKFPFATFNSRNLAKNLSDCDAAVVFCASVGIGIDRLIEKYKRVSPVKALFFSAIGTERVESLCDLFNEEIKAKVKTDGEYTVPRYSAGYGDFDLSAQREIFTALNPSKNIGVYLNDSLLMSPSKSVTAIIGISDKPFERRKNCKSCNLKSCPFGEK